MCFDVSLKAVDMKHQCHDQEARMHGVRGIPTSKTQPDVCHRFMPAIEVCLEGCTSPASHGKLHHVTRLAGEFGKTSSSGKACTEYTGGRQMQIS